ncbi:glutamine amidotransferase [Microbacterium sp.]|uniref:glutamine amidotransferase n=1 Tax=Microbacterium sp. TaxID=51671 RepID=UPI0028128860|nr:glutamine amidotransferase [Microbacterium sp.]
MTASVRIAQLYPVELGITGDRGNVRALQVRLERAGVAVDIVRVAPGDAFPEAPDVVIVGNGPLSAMRTVRDDLERHADGIRSFVADGGALLAVGGGAELLSRGVAALDGEYLDGLGVFPADVVRTRERKVGYIVAQSPLGRVIGFEDHASEWTVDDAASAFGRVVSGRGSFALPSGAGRGELVRAGNAFASNVQGPLLPLNPELTVGILQTVAARRGASWQLGAGVEALDGYAAGARAKIEQLVHDKVFNTIQL